MEQKDMMKGFPITSVARADLAERGYDVEKITDEQMEELAENMADAYCEGSFWQDLEIIADDMEIPKQKES